MPGLKDALNGVIREGAHFATDELVGWVEEAKKDQDEFVRTQGEMLELYIRKLARGVITRDEFEDLVQGLVDLKRIRAAKMSTAAKARAEMVAGRFRDLALDALLKVIKL